MAARNTHPSNITHQVFVLLHSLYSTICKSQLFDNYKKLLLMGLHESDLSQPFREGGQTPDPKNTALLILYLGLTLN